MVRLVRVVELPVNGFPHPRGDGPGISDNVFETLRFSPPAWGWSVVGVRCETSVVVFPTRVGMVRVFYRMGQTIVFPRCFAPLAKTRVKPRSVPLVSMSALAPIVAPGADAGGTATTDRNLLF